MLKAEAKGAETYDPACTNRTYDEEFPLLSRREEFLLFSGRDVPSGTDWKTCKGCDNKAHFAYLWSISTPA